MRMFYLVAIVSSYATTLHSQCTLACNDQLEINIGNDGFFVITLPILFQGNLANCNNLGVELYDENFNFIGDTLTCAQVGTVVFARTVNYDTNSYCETDLIVVDKTAPQFTCPELFVACNAPISPDSIGYPLVDDNCTTILHSDLAYFDQMFDLNCFESQNGNQVTARIERTWLVSDDSGNQAQCVQFIYLLRSSLNDVVFPDHKSGTTALTCGVDDVNDFAITGKPLIEGREILPGGYCEISILYNDQVFTTCGGATTTIRKWLALDICTNNILEFDQIIELKDKVGPTIFCPADITVSANSFTCDAEITLPSITGTDECSTFTITPSWQFGIGYGPYSDVPAGQHTVTYRAVDACSNTTLCSMVVNIVDNTPPTPICENSISVSLLPSGVARVFASTFDEGSFDNCGIDRVEVRRGTDPYTDFVEFYCNDVASSPAVVQLRVYDNNGLFNECWINVTVNDYFQPELTCPTDKTIDCQDDLDDLALLGQPFYMDACGIDTVYYQDSLDLKCGVGTVNRFWTVVDMHGNSKSCEQTITVTDGSFLVITYPDNIAFDACTGVADTSFTGAPVIKGAGCKDIYVNNEDQYFSSGSYCYTIYRTWTVINWCVYDPNSGTGEGEYTYVQRIDVIDNTAPVFSCPVDTIVNNFSSDCNTTYISLSALEAIDCSGSVSIQNDSPFADSSSGNASGFYPNGTHSFHYTVYDGCGNATTCEQVLIVKDGLSPNLICKSQVVVDLSQNGTVTIDPSLLIASVSDNCTAANLLTFSLTPNTFTCDDIGMQEVTLTTTDLEGNASTCISTIDVQDNMFNCSPSEVNISGKLLNVKGEPVANMEVFINNLFFTVTDANGFYSFNNLPAGGDYMLRVADVPLVKVGISTYDMVLIAAHILQTRELTDPYKIIAVDVDNSNTINVLDMLSIRQLILEMVDRFSSDIAWKCIDANYIFSDNSNPFQDNYPLDLSFNQLHHDVSNADFVAVKLGDIDGDGANLSTEILEHRYINEKKLAVENKKLHTGEDEEIEFKLGKSIETYGLQFDLLINPEYVAFDGLVVDPQLSISDENFKYDPITGRLKFTWNTQGESLQLKANQVIFKLNLKGVKDCQLKEALTFLDEAMAPEIYDAQYQKQSLAISFVDGASDKLKSQISMSQNFPNPVYEKTTIEIFSDNYANGQIVFTNSAGEKVLIKQINLAPGKNIISFNADEFNSNSILFYSLIVDAKVVATKKMMIMVCP